MYKLNPLSHLPSRNTTMNALLYPVLLVVKFGVILYDNELPGRQHNARANICGHAEKTAHSSLKPIVSDAATVEVSKSPDLGSHASIVVGEEATSATASIQQINHGHNAVIDASTQTDGDVVSTDSRGGLRGTTQAGEESMAETSHTNRIEVGDGNSSNSTSSLTTLVNTPIHQSPPANAHDNEQQYVTLNENSLLEVQQGEGQVQVSRAVNENIDAENQQLRVENTVLQSSIVNLANILSQEQRKIAAAEQRANAAEEKAAAAEGLQTQLDEANSRISDSEDSKHNLRLRITALRTEVSDLNLDLSQADSRIAELEDQIDRKALSQDQLESRIAVLRDAAHRLLEKLADRDDMIRKGYEQLKLLSYLGTKLHARLIEAEKITKGALGRADGLMHLAAQWFPIAVPVESDFGDIINDGVEEGGDHEPKVQLKVQLAIEGPPADLSGTQNSGMVFGLEDMPNDELDTEHLVSDMFGVQEDKATDNEKSANVDAAESSFNNADFHDAGNVASSMSTATPEVTPQDSAVPAFMSAFATPNQATEPEVHDKKPGFTFSYGTLTQEIREETKSTAEKPAFAFSGTSARASQPKAEGTAKKFVFPFPSSPVQGGRQETPSKKTAPNGNDYAKKGANAQDFGLIGSLPVFGAQMYADPGWSGNAASSTSNFAFATSFDFASSTTFEAGSDSSTVRSNAFADANEDEQNEEPGKKSKSTPIYNATTPADVSPPSFDPKKEEPNNKSKPASSIFDAATSVNLSSLFSGNQAASGQLRDIDGFCPDPSENFDYLYEVEDDYKVPVKEVEQIDATSAMISADNSCEKALPFVPSQASSSIIQAQLPGLSVSSESNVSELQEVTGAESSRTSSSLHLTPECRREDGAADVFRKLGLDAAALARIVGSVSPSIQENRGAEEIPAGPTEAIEARREGWQGRSRTAEEIDAAWKVECRERAIVVDGQEPWREPEWPAALPPLAGAPITATSTRRSAATQSAVSDMRAKLRRDRSVSSQVSKGIAFMSETAPVTIRNADGHSSLIEEGKVEGAIQDAMDAVESLVIGPPHPPPLGALNADVHFLSGDWVARWYTIRGTDERHADRTQEEILTEIESQTRCLDTRETEVLRGSERHVEQEIEPQIAEPPTLTPAEMRGVGRFLTASRNGRVAKVIGQRVQCARRKVARGTQPQVTKTPALTTPEVGKEDVSTTRAGGIQGSTAMGEQERRAEPEVAEEKERYMTDSACASNVAIELQMAPQMEVATQMMASPEMMAPQMILQMDAPQTPPEPPQTTMQLHATADLATQPPEPTTDTGHESGEQAADPPRKKPSSGGLYIWSLRKKRT